LRIERELRVERESVVFGSCACSIEKAVFPPPKGGAFPPSFCIAPHSLGDDVGTVLDPAGGEALRPVVDRGFLLLRSRRLFRRSSGIRGSRSFGFLRLWRGRGLKFAPGAGRGRGGDGGALAGRHGCGEKGPKAGARSGESDDDGAGAAAAEQQQHRSERVPHPRERAREEKKHQSIEKLQKGSPARSPQE